MTRTLVDINTGSMLSDIRIERPDLPPLHLLGTGGAARECAAVESTLPAHCLPVLLGSGMGHALRALLRRTRGPVAVVDKEQDILARTGLRDSCQDSRLLWVDDPDPQAALQCLSRWQLEHGGLPFHPLPLPVYARLDAAYYGAVRKALQTSASVNFWNRAARPRFCQARPRLLLLTSKYFLMGELESACRELDVDFRMLSFPDETIASSEFIKALLESVVDFQPDCIVTLNHLGVDRDGVLMDLLERLRLPLASWFLDNPQLILQYYAKQRSPWLTLFTWDTDNIALLREQGFEHVHYLPLGTNPERFHPQNRMRAPQAWRCDVSFVGNSMRIKTGMRLKAGRFPRAVLRRVREVAHQFRTSPERSVRTLLAQHFPEVCAWFHALPCDEDRLIYEATITWLATGMYRADCVRQLLPFHPRIVGDAGWQVEFRHEAAPPEFIHELSYYDELPLFYVSSTINFNATSQQMKGAVNQRIFDVPASGAFVLTDWREQLPPLLEPGREIIAYRSPEEIPELTRYYLTHDTARQAITAAGRTRILAEHTWSRRMQTLLRTMRGIYGGEGAAHS